MKTLLTANGSVIRRKDDEAARMVAGEPPFLKGDFEYCPKSMWKKLRTVAKGQGKNKVTDEQPAK